MYEFGEIDVLDSRCEVSSIDIMHDKSADEFALVKRLRETPEIMREAKCELVTADLLTGCQCLVFS